MNNPEFKRNLWLELSPSRLILMPAVLGIIAALTVYLSADMTGSGDIPSALLIVFTIIGLMLVGAWGSFAVLGSINSEVAERTWDQQRLSSLSPWQMAWGKLLGASIYPWFGGLICAGIVLASGLLMKNGNPPRVILLLLASIIGCLALHCWIMASRLHTMDANAGNGSSLIKRLFGLYILLQILPGILFMGIGFRSASQSEFTRWWGLPLGFASLSLLMACLALALGLLALWRTMSTQLMVRTTPWAWALGCTAAGLSVAGFADGPDTAVLWPMLVAGVALLATYLMLFTEKNNAMIWRAVVFHARQGNWKRMLQTLPLWPVSWLLALLFGLIHTLHGGMDTAVHRGISHIMWLALLHALRDAGIYLFFAWRNTTRKPLGMALLTYFVLSVVLPLFFKAGSDQLALLFEPMYSLGATNSWSKGELAVNPLSWIAMLAHLVIVGSLLAWRWKQSVALQAQ